MEDPKLFDPDKAQFPPAPAQDITIEPEQTVEETPKEQQEQEVQALPVQERQTSEEQENFKAVRSAWRQAEKERDEYARRLQQIETQRQPQQQPEEDDEPLLGLDEIAEGKHIKPVYKKLKTEAARNRQMQEDLEKQKQQLAALIAEQTIKTRYPDFDKIVNEDTVKILRTNYPDIAITINSNPDFVTKAAAAYTMIKNLNIIKEDIYSADRERAQRNAAKPRPIASVSPQQGNSPLAQANVFAEGLTDDTKAQYYKEMMESRKNY
jgi:hypothetical protein